MTRQDMHLHSNFSDDGKNSIEEMVKTALTLGLKEIAFTEHVRRNTDWLDKFVRKIKEAQRKYPQIKIYSGIEAKAIDLDGNIDAKEEFFNKVDLVLGALHRIPKAKEAYLSAEEILADKKGALKLWYQAMTKLLRNKNVDIIAHPGSILKKYGIKIPNEMKRELAKNAKKHQKTFEVNKQYRVPDRGLLKILKSKKVKIVYGSNSHSVKDLMNFSRGKDKIVVATSGYFDPLHQGHLELFSLAKKLGTKLIVIVNSDYQAKLKKGFSFMPEEERLAIISSLKMVDEVILAIDKDKTVSKTLALLGPNVFAKGGDSALENIPESEQEVCKRLGTRLVLGLGKKIQSSSWLLKALKERKAK